MNLGWLSQGDNSIAINQDFVDYFDAVSVKVEDLFSPKKIEITHEEKPYDFTLHKIPAMTAKMLQDHYVQASIPKISAPQEKEAITKCILRFITVDVEGEKLQLDGSPHFTNIHVGHSVEVLQKLENEMIAYNFSFLPNGVPSILDHLSRGALGQLVYVIGEILGDSSISSYPTG